MEVATKRLVVAGIVGALTLFGMAEPAWAQFNPGIGLCAPLPDPPLILDWTIRAIKLALGGEIDCGL